jgi:hypothetical protein
MIGMIDGCPDLFDPVDGCPDLLGISSVAEYIRQFWAL